MNDEKDFLESALPRTFLVAIQPTKFFANLGGKNLFRPQMLKIEALSVAKAKRKAIQMVSIKQFRNRKPWHWEITSVQDLNEVSDGTVGNGN